MRLPLPFIALALSFIATLASGETITLTAHNCAIDLPDGWVTRPQSGTPDRFILEAKNAAGDRQISVLLDTLPMQGREAIDAYLTAIKQLNVSQNWRNAKPVTKTIGGLPFTFLTYGPEDQPHRVMFMAFVGSRSKIYNISGFKKGGDASKDTELLAIADSFRFLKSATAVRR